MEKKSNEVKKGVLPKIARVVGQRSVDTYCFWWYNQPKVPESMKKEKNEL